jgi:hypothetical protein
MLGILYDTDPQYNEWLCDLPVSGRGCYSQITEYDCILDSGQLAFNVDPMGCYSI